MFDGRGVVMEFRLLGPVEVWTAAGPVDVGPSRQRAVLAALLVDAGRPVTVETVIDRVWGDTPPDRVRHTLYVYVARLRKAPGSVRRPVRKRSEPRCSGGRSISGGARRWPTYRASGPRRSARGGGSSTWRPPCPGRRRR